jgi:hypothetical protein
MTEFLNQIGIALKALRQLGPKQISYYAFYRLALETGWMAYKSRVDVAQTLHHPPAAFKIHPLLHLPGPQDVSSLLGDQGVASLFTLADEITSGTVHPFGGEPVSLDLANGSSTQTWTAFASGRAGYPVRDVKYLWEPARFGWAFTLGCAYLLNGDERYAAAFWHHTSLFLDAHPPNTGPHWVSAQEVALRILAFTWTAQAFAASPHTTFERLTNLGKAVASSAARIPATLSYSRAQNNNHLLSEAVGLLTAGLALPDHPRASTWIAFGWHLLNCGLLDQISPSGSYVQHSTSYHRLMLQLALWVHAISQLKSRTFSPPVLERLSAATSWLLALLDMSSGHVPNLGPNDGANILPLTICHPDDYRPVLQAASQTFLGEPRLPSGDWDEMGLWLGLRTRQMSLSQLVDADLSEAPDVMHNPANSSWAYLRAARFNSRPGHADQLHLDLWWRGLNIAQDAGTYLYSAPPPWDNSLTHTAVHNTLTVDDQEQMFRAGKFLYLDWAQAQLTCRENAQDDIWERITAQHDGYERLGLIHQRTVTTFKDGNWQIDDFLKPVAQPLERSYRLRLHWLVPDWHWEAIEFPDVGCRIDLESPYGCIKLHIGIAGSSPSDEITGLLIVRAGRVLHGYQAEAPTWGWISPTYGVKLAALSLSFEVKAALPITFTSHWHLPSVQNQIRD